MRIHWTLEFGIIEASDVGLAPGIWLEEIMVDGLRLKLQNIVRQNGEIIYVNYRTDDGRVVRVLND